MVCLIVEIQRKTLENFGFKLLILIMSCHSLLDCTLVLQVFVRMLKREFNRFRTEGKGS